MSVVEVRGIFAIVDLSLRDVSRQICEREDVKPLTRTQVETCLLHLKKVLDLHARDPEVCWGYVEATQTELDAGALRPMATGDRIGMHTAFTMWKDHLPEHMRGMLAMKCGVMVMVQETLDPAKHILFMIAHGPTNSKAYDVMVQMDRDMNLVLNDLQNAVTHFRCGGLVYTTQPFLDAFYNRKHMYKSLNLSVVVGSLGVKDQNGQPVWWEHGDASWTTLKQFRSNRTLFDAYFWLEDGTGRIYDVLRPGLLGTMLMIGISVPNETFPRLVSGLTRDEMEAQGFLYVPAPKDTQNLILSIVREVYSAQFQALHC